MLNLEHVCAGCSAKVGMPLSRRCSQALATGDVGAVVREIAPREASLTPDMLHRLAEAYQASGDANAAARLWQRLRSEFAGRLSLVNIGQRAISAVRAGPDGLTLVLSGPWQAEGKIAHVVLGNGTLWSAWFSLEADDADWFGMRGRASREPRPLGYHPRRRRGRGLDVDTGPNAAPMIHSIRRLFNEGLTDERYRELLDSINRAHGSAVKFRVAETPIFVDKFLGAKIFEACDDVVDTICRPDFKALTEPALPSGFRVPGEGERTLCLLVDLGICRGEDGGLEPRIIEIQGVPSLYCWESLLEESWRRTWPIPEGFRALFGGLTRESYLDLLRRAFVGDHDPENVVLLEIEPNEQGTHIDFLCTERDLGVRPVCISEVVRRGRNLFYVKDGRTIPIERIYNRVIYDEWIRRQDLRCQFRLTEEVDVEWAGHPHWYFRISKFTLPFIQSDYLPESRFLHEVEAVPHDLDNFVLKPLYSFSGDGVVFNVTPEDLARVGSERGHLLQRKVHYAPAIQAPDGGVKAEIRILYLWQEGLSRPTPVVNLARIVNAGQDPRRSADEVCRQQVSG